MPMSLLMRRKEFDNTSCGHLVAFLADESRRRLVLMLNKRGGQAKLVDIKQKFSTIKNIEKVILDLQEEGVLYVEGVGINRVIKLNLLLLRQVISQLLKPPA